ncbi:hemocytin-like [Centruroides sculpturatus]|uniref:hemocytin-like n=1 Tax=Centruroides sculpturatus TaxID=218467 RepID=UPI000C6DFB92|nr:hemocytin-like [Centruroides sculpturatus]
MVFKNGSCTEKLYCNTCDDNGHLPGDTWFEEKCTICTCTEKLRIECREKVCPNPPICNADEKLKEVSSNNNSCCSMFICQKALSQVSCPATEVPTCKRGESAKLITEGNCPNYTCVCEPVLCPPITKPNNLKPGQTTEIIKSECCPEIQIICKNELCPPVISCPSHLELKQYDDECCPIYQCEISKEKGVYTHEYGIDETGYDFLIPLDELQVSVYKPNETWTDGLCRNCTCKYNHKKYVAQCAVQECPDIYSIPENLDYEIMDLYQPNRCCPELIYVNCKDENGNIYKIGDQWQNKSDPCQIFECAVSPSGQALKIVKKEECSCEKGEEQQLPSVNECCGKCIKTHCFHFDTLYSLNETWSNPVDRCQKYECKLVDNELTIVKQTCLPIREDCPEENLILDKDNCCTICNATFGVIGCNTLPKVIEVGELKKNDSNHGLCVNPKRLSDVLECGGTCESHSMYSLESQEYKSSCKCCSPVDVEVTDVELMCDDGYKLTERLAHPKTCACYPCSGSNSKLRESNEEENSLKNNLKNEEFSQNNLGEEQYSQNSLGQEQYSQSNVQEQNSAQNDLQNYAQNLNDYDLD